MVFLGSRSLVFQCVWKVCIDVHVQKRNQKSKHTTHICPPRAQSTPRSLCFDVNKPCPPHPSLCHPRNAPAFICISGWPACICTSARLIGAVPSRIAVIRRKSGLRDFCDLLGKNGPLPCLLQMPVQRGHHQVTISRTQRVRLQTEAASLSPSLSLSLSSISPSLPPSLPLSPLPPPTNPYVYIHIYTFVNKDRRPPRRHMPSSESQQRGT